MGEPRGLITTLPRFETYHANGVPNGFLVSIWNASRGEALGQIYFTTIEPGEAKGPHLHMRRCGRFVCVRGAAEIIVRFADRYQRFRSEEGSALVRVPPGVPAQLRCLGHERAYVLNMPTPGWDPDDEWPVDDWEPPADAMNS